MKNVAPQHVPMRSALYLPGINQRAIEKARSLAADVVIFDLEDAVAPEMKAQARRNLEEAFQGGPVARGLNVIRINAPDAGELASDLETVRKCRPHALLLPKVSNPYEVAVIRRHMAGSSPNATPALWCMIESTLGLMRVADIAAALDGGRPAVACLVIGTNDIARETGVSTEQGRHHMHPWLMAAVLAAKANGVALLDGVWNDFKDTEGFEVEAVQGRMMGFDGKTLIHPTQIEPANRVFAPGPEAVEEARVVVAAFAEPANAGKGVINLSGRMVELLHLQMARRVLDRHEAIQARMAGSA
jgi:citrate lyase subunit beta/citryl-CoA lyase